MALKSYVESYAIVFLYVYFRRKKKKSRPLCNVTEQMYFISVEFICETATNNAVGHAFRNQPRSNGVNI